jgi:hypothetical protein
VGRADRAAHAGGSRLLEVDVERVEGDVFNVYYIARKG